MLDSGYVCYSWQGHMNLFHKCSVSTLYYLCLAAVSALWNMNVMCLACLSAIFLTIVDEGESRGTHSY